MSPPAKIAYYVIRERHGRKLGYWCPTPRMKALGFSLVPCGEDGPEARAQAALWTARWQEARAASRGEPAAISPSRSGYVYFLRCGDRIKIGFSKQPLSRAGDLATGMPDKPSMIAAFRGTKAEETRLHRRFDAYRRKGEWFTASPLIMKTIMRSVMIGRLDMPDVDVPNEQTGSESLTA
ncbi:hypothetical protein ABID82_005256 [Methylobacterium sp. PvP062]|uniref:GIY-YIG nuclease family protein n=1 Tax=Methylobacterium radiotolerans TaxID=31998 RepID=A0ABV2NQQ2_9HYPH|nr:MULTISPECIES: GIY-YIG nuclease family protein [unclassified Methylobacterium]MBP2494619.1 hypothetical protein [Methylobacterium sp. PvP105]MBP2499007.1 hypothetical protein [Methylobacterium sp. PvP109]MCX7330092.1 GIY-YIG nuclease family protein [Hyphomicrobiales bacterium]